MREKWELVQEASQIFNNQKVVYKVFPGLFYNTKPLTNYQTLQLITLLHKDKLGKKSKIKSQSLETNLVRVAKILQGLQTCKIGKVAIAFCALLSAFF